MIDSKISSSSGVEFGVPLDQELDKIGLLKQDPCEWCLPRPSGIDSGAELVESEQVVEVEYTVTEEVLEQAEEQSGTTSRSAEENLEDSLQGVVAEVAVRDYLRDVLMFEDAELTPHNEKAKGDITVNAGATVEVKSRDFQDAVEVGKHDAIVRKQGFSPDMLVLTYVDTDEQVVYIISWEHGEEIHWFKDTFTSSQWVHDDSVEQANGDDKRWVYPLERMHTVDSIHLGL